MLEPVGSGGDIMVGGWLDAGDNPSDVHCGDCKHAVQRIINRQQHSPGIRHFAFCKQGLLTKVNMYG